MAQTSRAFHVAVTRGDTVIVWGGQVNSDHFLPGSQVMIFNIDQNRWSPRMTTGDVPPGLSDAAAAVLDDAMYVVGGWTAGREFSRDIWSLNLNSFVWTRLSPEGVPPLRCFGAAAWSHEDKIWMFGGQGDPPSDSQSLQLGLSGGRYVPLDDEEGISNQLVCYNTATNAWEWLASSGTAPSPRAGHSVAKVDGTVYVFGGRQENTVNDFYSLDLNTLRFEN